MIPFHVYMFIVYLAVITVDSDSEEEETIVLDGDHMQMESNPVRGSVAA